MKKDVGLNLKDLEELYKALKKAKGVNNVQYHTKDGWVTFNLNDPKELKRFKKIINGDT